MAASGRLALIRNLAGRNAFIERLRVTLVARAPRYMRRSGLGEWKPSTDKVELRARQRAQRLPRQGKLLLHGRPPLANRMPARGPGYLATGAIGTHTRVY